jgi:sialate O-acetylesterase
MNTPKSLLCTLSLTVIAIALASQATAQDAEMLRFSRIISDNMVLQQQKPITLWGWAKPNAEVKVTMTQDTTIGKSVAEKLGEPFSAGKDNDAYTVTMRYVEKNPPNLETRTLKAQAGRDGRWSVQFPSAKASFKPTWLIAESGQKMIVVQNVLIGEIWLCAGQSNMGWGNFNRKDREAASADFPGLRYIAWEDSWYKPLPDVRKKIQWQECSPQTAQRFSAVPYLYGTFLHRYLKVPVGIINVARGGTLGQTWCMREELDTLGGDLMKTVLAEHDSQTAVWDDPEQVAGLMTQWEKACDTARAEHVTKVVRAKAEGKKEPRLRLPKKPGDARAGWSPPAGLFNATVMPIRQLGLRGVLYYQGENNNFMRWTRYESTFPKVPVSFRKAFGDESLPFGCISQPGWGTFGIEPEMATVAEGYAIIRDIQRRALKDDPNAGMIATYPTGNSYIHPAEKLPVAEYASLWALAKVYGKKVVHRGNQFTEMKKKDGKLFLFFDQDPVVHDRWKHIENNAAWQVLPMPREGKAPVQGFIIAGADRRWYPAKAREAKADNQWCIELSSDLVKEPVAARYGWANWPTGNLVGRERIPVPTFRTDNWPIPKGMNYSPEAKQSSEEKIKALRETAKRQAIERKIRQMQIDLPSLERDLNKGDAKGQIESKISRLEALLNEFETDPWLSRQLNEYDSEFAGKLEGLRKTVSDLKKQ